MSEYCECEKKPGGILEVNSLNPNGMYHMGCGKLVGPMPEPQPKERRPVYCAHPNKESKPGNDCSVYDCALCGSHWSSWDGEPKKEIGWVEG